MKIFSKAWLLLKKHGPTIGTFAGVGCMLGGTVTACRATRKLDDVMAPYWDALENENLTKKERFKVQCKAAWALTKLYGVSAGLEVGGSALIIGSHCEEHGNFVKASVAANGLLAALNAYRSNVEKYVGKESEEKLYLGYQPDENFDDKKAAHLGEGREAKLLPDLKKPEIGLGASVYARYFAEGCPEWTDNPEYNHAFLQGKRKEMQKRFERRGYLLLNEVYEALGMQATQEGCIVGWIWQEGRDNVIDFGLDTLEARTTLIEWKEPRVLLDFNVDGVIYDKIKFKW